jgi:hypothetical protein
MQHVQQQYAAQAYAALRVLVVKSPGTEGQPAAVTPLNPYATAAAKPQPSGGAAGDAVGGAAAAERHGGEIDASLLGLTSGQWMWIRISVCVLLVALLLGKLRQQPVTAVLQLLLLFCAVAADAARSAATAAAAATVDWHAGVADGAASNNAPNWLQQIAAALVPARKQQQGQQCLDASAAPQQQQHYKAHLHRPLRTASTYTMEGRPLIVPPAATAAAAAGSAETAQPQQLNTGALANTNAYN